MAGQELCQEPGQNRPKNARGDGLTRRPSTNSAPAGATDAGTKSEGMGTGHGARPPGSNRRRRAPCAAGRVLAAILRETQRASQESRLERLPPGLSYQSWSDKNRRSTSARSSCHSRRREARSCDFARTTRARYAAATMANPKNPPPIQAMALTRWGVSQVQATTTRQPMKNANRPQMAMMAEARSSTTISRFALAKSKPARSA